MLTRTFISSEGNNSHPNCIFCELNSLNTWLLVWTRVLPTRCTHRYESLSLMYLTPYTHAYANVYIPPMPVRAPYVHMAMPMLISPHDLSYLVFKQGQRGSVGWWMHDHRHTSSIVYRCWPLPLHNQTWRSHKLLHLATKSWKSHI